MYSKKGEFYYNLTKKNEKIFHSFACLSSKIQLVDQELQWEHGTKA